MDDGFFNFESILETSAEASQILREHTAEDRTALWSDCPFPDHIDDPLLLLRLLFGVDYAKDLEYRDDPEFIAHALDKWVQILRRAAQGAQSSQCEEVARTQNGVHPDARGAAAGGQ